MPENINFKNGYAELNGIKLYYEIYGEGKPVVLIHGGGSTIETNYGKIIPFLAKNRQIIAVELQAHGRTADRDKPLSFEQDADDVAALLTHLQINKADILGFSNGGQTSIEIALRHPELINKLILSSTFCKHNAVFPQFWDIFKNADLKNMPQALKDGFLKVNNDSAALLKMFNRDVERMQNFKGWSDTQIKSITVPTLIMNGTKDVATVEHAMEMHRLISSSDLVILPGVHGQYLGEVTTLTNGKWEAHYAVEIIEEFLNSSKP
ncbi:MAG: alpha/beta hydrolase [Bacteroidetes bacterium]|nr:alpha/beta hydrolase [Bacteroidota bacterium]